MTKRKVEDDSEDVASEDEDEAPKKSAKPKAKAAPRKKKDAAVPAPSVTEDGWHIVPPGFMFKQFGPSVPSAKIAAVDLDGTMITQKSTLKFGPKDADDWKWFNKKKTPEALRGFVEDGYRLVMITNQGSIKAKFDGPAADKVRGRISNVIAELDLPVLVLVATEVNDKSHPDKELLFRKPATGMWQHMAQHLNGGIAPDPTTSFFVGDAAGRPRGLRRLRQGHGRRPGHPVQSAGGRLRMEGKKHAPTAVKGAPAPPPPPPAFAEGSSPNEALISAFLTAAQEFEATSDEPGTEWFKSNKFRAGHNKKVATALKSFPSRITLQNLKELGKLPGVGKGSVTAVKLFLETGSLKSDAAAEDLGPAAVAAPSKSAKEALQFM
ncbi:MAG: hypothetical protein WDW36_008168 [Sanguina aurantia]